MAAAAAAGLNRGGIRRTAFSTGDLQALSVLPPKSSPSPPDPVHANLHRSVRTLVDTILDELLCDRMLAECCLVPN